MKQFIFILSLFFIFLSCNKEKKYSNIPKITFQSLSKQTLLAGNSSDALDIIIKFEDGDGNIGFGTPNLYVIDSRHDTDTVVYTIPKIPVNYTPENGVSGLMYINMQAAFLQLRSDTLHTETDTLHWTIYLKDKADNVSNIITTTNLVLTK